MPRFSTRHTVIFGSLDAAAVLFTNSEKTLYEKGKTKMTTYAPHFEYHINNTLVMTCNKLVTVTGETYVTFQNNITGVKETRVYKTERAADIQITKTHNKFSRVYGYLLND